jgi:hypothetical protein
VATKTNLQVRMWHKSASKKKGKKRVLVAQADLCLGDILRRFGADASMYSCPRVKHIWRTYSDTKVDETEFDVRLATSTRQTSEPRRVRGVRSGPSMLLRLRAPSTFASGSSSSATLVDEESYQTDNLSMSLFTSSFFPNSLIRS